MNLIKWIRKNERKLIAIFVVVLMIAFVGGYALTQILQQIGPGDEVVATFGDGEEITREDISNAQNELQVLQMMGITEFLYMWPEQAGGRNAHLLAQILFPNSEVAAQLDATLKQRIFATPDLKESDVNKFFSQAGQNSTMNWILLKSEAQRAGCVISTEAASQTYDAIIASMSQQRASAAQILNSVMERTRLSQDSLMKIFADLRSVMLYADLVTSTQNVTLPQLKNRIGFDNETLSAEYVNFDAGDYIDMVVEPTEEELNRQFDAFKEYRQRQYAAANPYGFGYKLPNRVQLGYIYVELDDVESVVEKPTEDELIEYYQANTHEFTRQEAVDKDDPESEKVEKVQDFAEVRNRIRGIIIRQRTNNRADMIINEALSMADSALVELDIDEASVETLQQNAPNYEQIAQELTEKYGVKVYAGTTGYFDPIRLANDSVLGNLRVEGTAAMGTDLTSIVFAVEPLQVTELGRYEMKAPKMWTNLGTLTGFDGRAVVRVVDAKPEQVPESMDVSYPVGGVQLGEVQAEPEVFSVREQVAEDVKALKAMEIARSKADALMARVANEGWEKVLEADEEDGDNEQVRTTTVNAQRRMSLMQQYFLEAAIKAMPAQADQIQQAAKESRRADTLFALADQEGGQVQQPELLEFKPGQSWFVVRSIDITPATTAQLEEQRGRQAQAISSMSSQSVLLLHYMPENIHKRTGFAFEDDDESQPETDSPHAEPEN